MGIRRGASAFSRNRLQPPCGFGMLWGMFPRAIGDGIELRPLEECHAEALYRLVERNRARLRIWLPWVDTTRAVADCLEFIRTARAQRAAGEALHLGIWAGGQLAGGTGYRAIDRANRSASIGYWLDGEAEGRGIVTRSTAALTDHLIREMAVHRVEIRCAVGNTRSCAVPARLGFTREGVLRQAEWVNDRFQDLVVWSMLAHEWK